MMLENTHSPLACAYHVVLPHVAAVRSGQQASQASLENMLSVWFPTLGWGPVGCVWAMEMAGQSS